MKILVVSQIYTPQKEGGAERVARQTADMLRRNGHHVSILALSHKKAGPASDLDADIPVYRVGYKNDVLPGTGPMDMGHIKKLWWHMQNAVAGPDQIQLESVLGQVDPDIIYEHNSRLLHPSLAKAAQKRNIPTIVHLHDYGWLCPRNSMIKQDHNCQKPCTDCKLLTMGWRAAAQPKRVISVSNFVKDRYQKAGVFPTATWHVLRNASPKYTQSIAATSPRKFGFIGALAPDKGIEDLLHAFARLDVPKATLTVAGSGLADYTQKLHEICRTHNITDRVTWLGQVDQNNFYSQVDCVVVPSRWHEPQSLVLGETLSQGIPLIGSDCGGTTEVIRGSKGGLLFDPQKPGDLTQALHKMMQTPADQFALNTDGILPTPDEYERQLVKIIVGENA